MATALKPISHEDRLSLVDHLDELRKRLIICVVGLVVAFGFCFWQNHAILDIVTNPYTSTQDSISKKPGKDPLAQAARFQRLAGSAFKSLEPGLASVQGLVTALGTDASVPTAIRAQAIVTAAKLAPAISATRQAAQATPTSDGRNLVTLGVTEPFTSTLTIAMYAALLLTMPLLLYQAYAFILPAFSPRERKVALPVMAMVPFLFVSGVAFGYFFVLPRALQFLQNFNHGNFDILLQAQPYFRFAVLLIGGIGLLFQIPVGVLAVTRMGILTPRQLAKNRGYVILGIAIVAAVATPTPDPVTMTLAMAPLIVLFEASILLARWLERVKPAASQDAEDVDDDEVPFDGDPDFAAFAEPDDDEPETDVKTAPPPDPEE